MTSLLELKQYGQSYWIDDLTRTMIQDGSLHRRVQEEGLTGVTSNPSTFKLAIVGSDAYDEQVRMAAREGSSARNIYELLATTDVRNACDALRPVYDSTEGADGYVSLEISPHLAHDSAASIDEARRLFSAVDRPNLMIKIPGTVAGLLAIEELLWEGVNVNITLLFSIKRYKAVADVYQRALERRLQAGRSLHDVASVASFFLSRIDVLVDQLENEGVQKFIEPYDETLHVIERKRTRWAAKDSTDALARAARQLRRDVIRMTAAAGSGHPSSCLSAAEIVSALFFEQMRWDPSDAQARNVDTFILSKGHAAPILWAALARSGAIKEDLLTLRRINSTLEGHPTPNNPWVKVATGSLGQGLSAANGMALANRLDRIDARIYCLLGDGECSEGSVWEAAQFATLNKLANVVAIVDQNALGQSGPTPFGHERAVFAERFRAFGWQALEIDGHDLHAVREAMRSVSSERPTIIVAHTIKGKGVSFLEGQDGWHGKSLDREQCERALMELGTDEECPQVSARHVGESAGEPERRATRLELRYNPGAKVASRKAFGQALAALGPQMPQLVVLDGDVMNSTYTELFAKRCPERFFQSYIAEQNMVGVGLGLATSGKTVVIATFACFLTRAHDFIRMAAHSRPRHLIFCGSHAGVSIGEDGPSQMGLEDIAMFRALGESTVLCPSDAVSAERLTEIAMRTEGIVYLRTARPATDVLYDSADEFTVGGSKMLRQSDDDQATLVATGIGVYGALKAYDELRQQGISTRVIDAYSVKPLDIETLIRAARETRRILVIEDHWIDGGLGDAVAAAVGGIAPVQRLAVSEEPRSGSMDELLERHHISGHAISNAVMAESAAPH